MKHQSAAQRLTDQLCRTQHVGLFGNRGVGKTTFLTMLYREAVGGRLPDLRMAAADARTANYLSDKILQLESGEAIPATLGETELHFHLYYKHDRYDLLVKDYQGEHVTLGREEPIRDFLKDCDAVWFCLDVSVADQPAANLRSQQEVEQTVEDYLKSEIPGIPARPMALVLTKADLLAEKSAQPTPDPEAITELIDRQFNMTQHAITAHAPEDHALLAISSLGGKVEAGESQEISESVSDRPTFSPEPSGLAEPLLWLAEALKKLDFARMDALWKLAGNDVPLLQKAVTALHNRYPNDLAVKKHQRRLSELKTRLRMRRFLVATVCLLAFVAGLWGYDVLGARSASQFEAEHPEELVQVKAKWTDYFKWHPTRRFFRPKQSYAEEQHVAEVERRIRDAEAKQRLAELRLLAADPDQSAVDVWKAFERYQSDYPEQDVDDAVAEFREVLRMRRNEERERLARAAVEELTRDETKESLDTLLERAERLLAEHEQTQTAEAIREKIDAYLHQMNLRSIVEARDYSANNPTNFYKRREHYLAYLEKFPQGEFRSEAQHALATIEHEGDKFAFRKVRDYFTKYPQDLKGHTIRCDKYLAGYPEGKYVFYARQILRWCEQVAAVREYEVTLKRGSFDPSLAFWASRGMYLSVEIEVNGIVYGPTTIVKKSSTPEWNYKFPRPIKWKLGQPVRIRVTDNYYWKRKVTEFASDDPLAMKILSGTVASGKNRLEFASDFDIPELPNIE